MIILLESASAVIVANREATTIVLAGTLSGNDTPCQPEAASGGRTGGPAAATEFRPILRFDKLTVPRKIEGQPGYLKASLLQLGVDVQPYPKANLKDHDIRILSPQFLSFMFDARTISGAKRIYE